MSTGTAGAEEWGLEVKRQAAEAAGSYLVWVLGITLRSSGEPACALNLSHLSSLHLILRQGLAVSPDCLQTCGNPATYFVLFY